MLDTAQPAIGRQIGQLEREWGGRLFHRTGRGVALTELGEPVLPRAKSLLAQAAELVDEIKGTAGVPSGDVRIGVLPSLSQPLINASPGAGGRTCRMCGCASSRARPDRGWRATRSTSRSGIAMAGAPRGASSRWPSSTPASSARRAIRSRASRRCGSRGSTGCRLCCRAHRMRCGAARPDCQTPAPRAFGRDGGRFAAAADRRRRGERVLHHPADSCGTAGGAGWTRAGVADRKPRDRAHNRARHDHPAPAYGRGGARW